MSEGGQFPWKRQSHRSPPHYQSLMQPLPEPPEGLVWMRINTNPDTRNDWVLMDTRGGQDVMAIVEEEQERDANVVVASVDAVSCVALENVQPPMAEAHAEATTTRTTTTTMGQCQSNATDARNDDHNVPLPQATLVTATATTTNSTPTKSTTTEEVVDFVEHIILPTDTLAGLCLQYRISKRELQRANGFFGGDSLQLAPECLRIPITEKARRLGWTIQDVNSKPYKMATLKARYRHLSSMEAKWYENRFCFVLFCFLV